MALPAPSTAKMVPLEVVRYTGIVTHRVVEVPAQLHEAGGILRRSVDPAPDRVEHEYIPCRIRGHVGGEPASSGIASARAEPRVGAEHEDPRRERVQDVDVVGSIQFEALRDDRGRRGRAVERQRALERATRTEADDSPLLAVERVDVAVRVELKEGRSQQFGNPDLGATAHRRSLQRESYRRSFPVSLTTNCPLLLQATPRACLRLAPVPSAYTDTRCLNMVVSAAVTPTARAGARRRRGRPKRTNFIGLPPKLLMALCAQLQVRRVEEHVLVIVP